ncbi:MAG: competence/damage-inducible protein A [Acidimicrobiales bacterium]|nr:competence/damage-inducible protein A [Acidimicrobiales bacterium]
MRCDVVAVGTELLLGQIVDTNSSWIGEQLALSGIDSLRQTKVGDNLDRIVGELRDALARADAVIVCGGLGPTQDDITRDAIAEVMGVALVRDHDLEDRIRSMFGSRGRFMPDNNLRQADVPEGASILDDMPGTAPGLRCPVATPDGEKVIYAVPGVPWEMQQMLTGSILPDLRRRSGDTSVIRSRVVRTWGQSESGLAEMLAAYHDELEETGRCTLAFLASGIEGLKVRLTAKAATAEEADALLADEVRTVCGVLGDYVFSVDDESVEEVVVRLLHEQGLTIGAAESVTGGLITARLTDVPGASAVVRGGVVSYASDVKFSVLGVPEGPVVTEEAAMAMARGACEVLGCDAAVSTTGVAGPDPMEGLPPGTVWLGTCVDGEAAAVTVRLPGDRDRVRQFATISVLNLLRQQLERRAR